MAVLSPAALQSFKTAAAVIGHILAVAQGVAVDFFACCLFQVQHVDVSLSCTCPHQYHVCVLHTTATIGLADCLLALLQCKVLLT